MTCLRMLDQGPSLPFFATGVGGSKNVHVRLEPVGRLDIKAAFVRRVQHCVRASIRRFPFEGNGRV